MVSVNSNKYFARHCTGKKKAGKKDLRKKEEEKRGIRLGKSTIVCSLMYHSESSQYF